MRQRGKSLLAHRTHLIAQGLDRPGKSKSCLPIIFDFSTRLSRVLLPETRIDATGVDPLKLGRPLRTTSLEGTPENECWPVKSRCWELLAVALNSIDRLSIFDRSDG
jgi:hypothetical protein